MTNQAPYNALVINSNLAQHIPKRDGAPNPGAHAFERLHYYGREIYFPEPAVDLDDKPHVVVPPEDLENELYSVYGFFIPRPIRLRVVGVTSNESDLSPRQREVAEGLAGLGHGITLQINEPESVTLDHIRGLGLAWDVRGEATTAGMAVPFEVVASGVRGHAIRPRFDPPGVALIEEV